MIFNVIVDTLLGGCLVLIVAIYVLLFLSFRDLWRSR